MDVNYLAFVPIEQVILHNAEAGTVSYIEAEDFNYDGGSYKTFEEVGTGGTYEGLGAVSGIDFNNSGNASANYRVIPDNHPGMADSSWDAGRNGFDMTVDFKMGWNDDGDWYNYTRDFAAGSYAVFGRFSSGGAAINNELSLVTGDAAAADQTVESLGTFTGPATGGWNTMAFFPLNDADGELATVTLGGTSTVRLTKVGGNMDVNYLAFVPYVAPADTGPDLFDGYAVGLNFGADAPDGSGAGTMEAGTSAGLSVQQNWNSLAGAAGSSDAVVANDGSSSGITVEWASNNTWSSTGWGEENNAFEDGGDRTMMTGYLDTGGSTRSTVAISDIPADL